MSRYDVKVTYNDSSCPDIIFPVYWPALSTTVSRRSACALVDVIAIRAVSASGNTGLWSGKISLDRNSSTHFHLGTTATSFSLEVSPVNFMSTNYTSLRVTPQPARYAVSARISGATATMVGGGGDVSEGSIVNTNETFSEKWTSQSTTETTTQQDEDYGSSRSESKACIIDIIERNESTLMVTLSNVESFNNCCKVSILAN